MSKIVSLTRAASQKAVALHRRALAGIVAKAERAVRNAEFDHDVAERAEAAAWDNLRQSRQSLTAIRTAVDEELKGLPGA